MIQKGFGTKEYQVASKKSSKVSTASMNKQAKEAFEKLPPYRKKEINRYIGNLKNEETIQKNIERTIKYLTGEEVQGVLYTYKRTK